MDIRFAKAPSASSGLRCLGKRIFQIRSETRRETLFASCQTQEHTPASGASPVPTDPTLWPRLEPLLCLVGGVATERPEAQPLQPRLLRQGPIARSRPSTTCSAQQTPPPPQPPGLQAPQLPARGTRPPRSPCRPLSGSTCCRPPWRWARSC